MILLLSGQAACSCQNPSADSFSDLSQDFKSYWYNGEAELSSYQLEQARYGEIHSGEAMLIFVTEDFSKSKQVKLDNPAANPNDATSVLKLNMTKKFFTGVYPYSIMMSSFKPIQIDELPHVLKITTSSQEWCGHTFSQLNKTRKGYKVLIRSYFESEGDKEFLVEDADFVEDEIWQVIRIAPQLLPEGEISIIPSSIHARLRHASIQPEPAVASLTIHKSDPKLNTYTIDYKNNPRKLVIHFQKAFPYKISGWEEETVSGFGPNAERLVTRATLKESIQLDYWNHNDNDDAHLRTTLSLEMN